VVIQPACSEHLVENGSAVGSAQVGHTDVEPLRAAFLPAGG
jgi:hypothetical protein